MLERQLTEVGKQASRESKKSSLGLSKREELNIIESLAEFMAKGKDIRKGEWNGTEVNVINSLHLLTAKPMIYLCNMSEEDVETKENRWLPDITHWVEHNNPGDLIIPLSVPLEAKLAAMSAQEIQSVGLESQLPKIILAGYKALDLIHYFTCGPQEVRAWTVRNNSKAPQAAGVIHTDFERGFISADIMKIDELQQLGSEAAIKSAGKYLQKGKEYVMEDGDIVHFKFNGKLKNIKQTTHRNFSNKQEKIIIKKGCAESDTFFFKMALCVVQRTYQRFSPFLKLMHIHTCLGVQLEAKLKVETNQNKH
ncbi:unnamed protein product [Rhizopus stolonifer]